MSVDAVVFFIFAGLAVAGALSVILQRHPIHSALSLILVMASLAVLYLLLGAEFIAAIQVIVYAGAIMVLFVFVILLLNAGEEERTDFSQTARYIGVPVAAALLFEMAYLLHHRAPQTAVVPDRFVGRTSMVGNLLFKDFVLLFELTSILILIAILGALVLAKKERSEG